MDLSIVIPDLSNVAVGQKLFERLPVACSRLPEGTQWELVVNVSSVDASTLEASLAGLPHRTYHGGSDYAQAVREGIGAARGTWVLTMETGLAHSPFVIPELYHHRHRADVIVASRYVATGYDNAGFPRATVAKWGNRLLRWWLDFPVRDLTSSYRLYRRRIFDGLPLETRGFAVLLEILVRAYAAGWKLAEIPYHYFPISRQPDSAFVRMGQDYATALVPLWRLRNSIDCADYDERAFRSRIWFQRSWQRWRYHALVAMVRDLPRVLDVGCGSSQVLDGLPQADGCDIRLNKLRHKRGRSGALVRASVFDLPFRSNSYDGVIFSQVIEHLPRDPKILAEVVRVARPGGIVVVGTPDYATWWTTIEKIYGAVHPGGYADEHITHYTFDSLKAEVESLGCRYIDHAYVYGAELIMRFRKRAD